MRMAAWSSVDRSLAGVRMTAVLRAGGSGLGFVGARSRARQSECAEHRGSDRAGRGARGVDEDADQRNANSLRLRIIALDARAAGGALSGRFFGFRVVARK